MRQAQAVPEPDTTPASRNDMDQRSCCILVNDPRERDRTSDGRSLANGHGSDVGQSAEEKLISKWGKIEAIAANTGKTVGSSQKTLKQLSPRAGRTRRTIARGCEPELAPFRHGIREELGEACRRQFRILTTSATLCHYFDPGLTT